MLVDAAKEGDVEIPYFCYEPKLGNPVGACRMCLVEIEGIPKLQTSCSTPVKDGMVVHTQTDRVRHAQNAIVEFLLVNHPLDCPVCDKGGECPLQDITFGWGLGRSRFIEPKRHFEKPLALSPLIAIDRERCILCYRCVRFSQEISEDYQLIFAERGAHTFVSTHDGHPYVAPFSGNIVELCPVGALTSQPYRFRARPWDIEGAGGICTLCPSQCNVEFTVRDEKVVRVLSRDPKGAGTGGGPGGNPEVDDGWLCDKGRFAYQAIHVDERITTPLVRDGGDLRPVSWERALQAAAGLGRHKGHVGALVGGQATNEEGFLLPAADARGPRIPRHRLAQRRGDPAPDSPVRWRLPRCRPPCPTSSSPTPCWCSAASRWTTRRSSTCGFARASAAAASSWSSPPPGRARSTPTPRQVIRYAPGGEAAFLADLTAALAGGSAGEDARALAELLRDGGEDIVILWGERIGAGRRRPAGARRCAQPRRPRRRRAAGDPLGRQRPRAARGGRAPERRPRLRRAGGQPASAPPRSRRPPRTARSRRCSCSRPTRSATCPTRACWDRAMHRAGAGRGARVGAHRRASREHANVIFPAESHAEKEGTVVHPDGRLQRLRTAIAHPGEVRAGWSVIADIAKRAGLDLRRAHQRRWRSRSWPRRFRSTTGSRSSEIGGRGVRWPSRPQASAMPTGERPVADEPRTATAAPAQAAASDAAARNGSLKLGTLSLDLGLTRGRDLPGAALHDRPPADRARPRGRDRASASPTARRSRCPRTEPACRRRAAVRTGVPAGMAFLAEGIAADSANAADRARDRGAQAVIHVVVANVNYFEPWWIQIVKALVIFARGVRDPADADRL